MQESKSKRRWLILVAIWLGFSFVFGGLLTSPTIQFRLVSLSTLLAVTDLRLRDSLVGTLPPLPADSDIVFLGIDESSLTVGEDDPAVIAQSRALTLMTEPFPWSREVWALAIDRLLESGAKLVILDLLINSRRSPAKNHREVSGAHRAGQ